MKDMTDNVICPEKEVLSLFKEKHLTLATAESCTGGMIGERITALPGSSEIYAGGVISYTNEVKMKVLGVKSETLDAFDAVSVETASEMADGARRLTGSDIAVSVTGFAGPGGGTEDKPVGTVCFGLSTKNGTETYRKQFGENKARDEIRGLAADFALELALKAGKDMSYA